jgi:hypothetical protein
MVPGVVELAAKFGHEAPRRFLCLSPPQDGNEPGAPDLKFVAEARALGQRGVTGGPALRLAVNAWTFRRFPHAPSLVGCGTFASGPPSTPACQAGCQGRHIAQPAHRLVKAFGP